MQGWIKMHRCIINSSFYKNADMMRVWIHLLIIANHKDTETFVKCKKIKVKAGSTIATRATISSQLGISESKIQRILKVLEEEGNIEQQTNSKFRVISITNWEKYQTDEQQMNNKRTTNEQQMNTDKNVKNVKNEKNNKASKNKNVVGHIKKPEHIEQELWEDFLEGRRMAFVRDGKNETDFTERALKLLQTEARKAGFTDAEAMEYVAQHQYRGFKAEYVRKKQDTIDDIKKRLMEAKNVGNKTKV